MGSAGPARFDIRKIAIIGAGPSGLSAAKYLRAQGAFESIVIFEQQDEVGGVWNYSDLVTDTCPAPQMDPFYRPDPPIPSSHGPVFSSPMYDRLYTNMQGSLMGFSDRSFPSDCLLYPTREDVQDYLLEYSHDVRRLIRFGFQVKSLEAQRLDGTDKWHIEAQSTVGQEQIRDTFDAVVVATGHYSIPFIPLIRNMTRFGDAHPTVFSHSKQYRRPEAFEGRKVVIVGSGPSGIDIGGQVSKVAQQPVLLSEKVPADARKIATSGCEQVVEIEEFLPEERAVRFVDGRIERDIDAVIFCTGFLYSFPFLRGLQHKLITTGKGVHGLYKHLFLAQHPTLAFPALNMRAAPWPIAEGQAAVLSAVWSNALQLPGTEEMERWCERLYKERGEQLLNLKSLEDGLYINHLHDWAMTATHLGKEPPRWNDKMFWERRHFMDALGLFKLQGCKAKTMEDLGFEYEPGNMPTEVDDGLWSTVP